MIVVHLAVELGAVIERVDPLDRTLLVRTDDDESLVFQLNRATGHFTVNGDLAGARLRFVSESDW